jgi:hypothetical protein
MGTHLLRLGRGGMGALVIFALFAIVGQQPAAARFSPPGRSGGASAFIGLSPTDVVQTKTVSEAAPQFICDQYNRLHPAWVAAHPNAAAAPCQYSVTVTLGPAQSTGSTVPMSGSRLVASPSHFRPMACINAGCSYDVSWINITACSHRGGGCGNFSSTVHVQYQYNGNYVYLWGSMDADSNPGCYGTDYYPYSHSFYWCGVADNGSTSYSSFGSNWHEYAWGDTCNYQQRIAAYPSGALGTQYIYWQDLDNGTLSSC